MNAELKQKWIEALRSGKYAQTKGKSWRFVSEAPLLLTAASVCCA